MSIVVVKVDEIAESEWQEARARYGKNAPKWTEQFEDVCTRATAYAQQQMREQLNKIATDGPDATLDKRRAVLDRLLDTMQVHTVSAPQYRLFKQEDEELPSRIKSADESGAGCWGEFELAKRKIWRTCG